MISTVKMTLGNKLQLMNTVSGQMESKSNLPYSAQNQNLIEILGSIQNRLLIKIKENIITLTMLGFFAQKEDFIPHISQIVEEQNGKCWNELLRIISQYAERIANEFDKGSVLFHIEVDPQVLISREGGSSISGKTSEIINFADVFLKENQFMIISKRENVCPIVTVSDSCVEKR